MVGSAVDVVEWWVGVKFASLSFVVSYLPSSGYDDQTYFVSIDIYDPEPSDDICIGEKNLVGLGQISRRLMHSMLLLWERLYLFNLPLRTDKFEESLVPDYEVGLFRLSKPIAQIAVSRFYIVDGIGCGKV